MRFFFYQKTTPNFPWLGAKTSIEVIAKGLHTLNVPCHLSNNIGEIEEGDFPFLSDICDDLNPLFKSLEWLQKDYGIIPFHEDYLQASGPATAFFHYIQRGLSSNEGDPYLQILCEQPELIRYLPSTPKQCPLINYEVLKNARICIANSKIEAKTIQRNCKTAVTETVYWTPGFLFEKHYDYDRSFLNLVGLNKKDYILQIGRLEPRKNQLASILATRHLDIPLVFIATSGFDGYQEYAMTCLKAIEKWRKAPTIILSGTLPKEEKGNLRVIPIDPQVGISQELLVSAYQNAGLYLHPAFYELPGYVYLEAAKLGTPTIATEWSTLSDYFTNEEGDYELDDRILYALPYDINALEKKILLQFGKDFRPGTHRALLRTPKDVASDFLAALKHRRGNC